MLAHHVRHAFSSFMDESQNKHVCIVSDGDVLGPVLSSRRIPGNNSFKSISAAWCIAAFFLSAVCSQLYLRPLTVVIDRHCCGAVAVSASASTLSPDLGRW